MTIEEGFIAYFQEQLLPQRDVTLQSQTNPNVEPICDFYLIVHHGAQKSCFSHGSQAQIDCTHLTMKVDVLKGADLRYVPKSFADVSVIDKVNQPTAQRDFGG